jgi:drug/metabolite transporter (DMT)-like permease
MFLGLALGLDVAAGVDLDWRGIALAGMGALAYNALLFLSHRAASAGSGIELIFQANLVSALVFLPLAWLAGETAAPASFSGWVGLIGVAATFLAGILAFIAGVGRSGAVRTAALTNIEPLVAILGAVVFLGESLSLVQVLGIALAAAGIYAMSR